MIYLLPKEPAMRVIYKRLLYYKSKHSGVPMVYVRDVEYLLKKMGKKNKNKFKVAHA